MTMELFQERLSQAVEEFEEEHDCRIGFVLRDLQSSARVGWRDREIFHPASTMKIAVMIETFRQAAEGHFDMQDTIVANPQFESMIDGELYTTEARALLSERIGQPVPIITLVEQMMVVSDNLATNLLITLCDSRKITATMRTAGAVDGYVVRCLQDEQAYRAGISNRLSPADLEAMLVYIETAEGEFPDATSRAEMKRILLAQEFTDKIPRYLPEGVRVGHKTGSITAVHHDAGIVYTEDGKYVLVILTEGIADQKVSSEMIARLSLMSYNEWTALSRSPDSSTASTAP